MSAGGDVYQRIFARATVEWSAGPGGAAEARDSLRRAIALAVRELRAAMEKDGNPAVTLAHMRNLDDVAPESLAQAYALAERNCVYWPSPGEIRDLAGASESHAAAAALDWVLNYLGAHGSGGRRRGGAVTFAVDEMGRREMVAAGPEKEPPPIPPRIERALESLGNGSARHGLRYLSQHPRLKGWEEIGGEPPGRAVERMERQWSRCYLQASRALMGTGKEDQAKETRR